MADITSTASTIRAELARRRLTQADVAKALGISQPQVSARLSGDVDWRLTELQAIADLLGMPVASLVEAGAA